MNSSETLELGNEFLTLYREILNIDPVFKLNLRLDEGELPIEYFKDESSSLSWTVILRESSHKTREDVKYSVIEFLIFVLTEELDFVEARFVPEIRKRLVTRLTLAIDKIMPDFGELEADDD